MHKLVFRAAFGNRILDGGAALCSTVTSSHLLFYFYDFQTIWVMFWHDILIETGASGVIKDLREAQEKVWCCKRSHPMQLGNCFVRSFASRIRRQNDRGGVLPENLMRAINTGKSMLAGFLGQTSGSPLLPMIYDPVTGILLGLQQEALLHLPHCAIALGQRKFCPTEPACGSEGWDPHVRHNEAHDTRLQQGRSLTAHHPPPTGNEPKRPDRSRER